MLSPTLSNLPLQWLRAVKAWYWRVRYPKGVAWTINGSDKLVFSNRMRFVASLHWPHVWKPLMEEIKPNDVVVDCGAGSGTYAMGMGKRLGPEGKLIAVEPDQQSFSLLAENLGLNSLQASVRIYQAALGNFSGEVAFRHGEGPLSAVSAEGAAGKVRAATLDELIPEGPVDIMTVTVQGSELEFLHGAKAIFSDPKRRPRLLMIGLEPKRWAELGKHIALEDVLGFLEERGYDMAEARDFLTLSPDRFLPYLVRGKTER